MIDSKERFFELGARDIITWVDPVSGESMQFKELNGNGGFELLKHVRNNVGHEELSARALVMTAVKPDGGPLFDESDVPKIMEVKAGLLYSAGGKALEIAGIYGKKKDSPMTSDSSTDSASASEA